ncbi:MAG: hypothetical protein HPY45_16070 [Anaerolineae bacterium]|nr:hypothetical protein [Anaerolineae bacterium]
MAHADNSEAPVNERRLIVAVVIQAFEDARHDDLSAAEWLISDGQVWLEAIGIEADASKVKCAIAAYKSRKRKNQKL